MARTDHDLGTSTFSCLKMTLPASSVISAVRFSHSIWSKGLTLASLKTRFTWRVLWLAVGFTLRPGAEETAPRRRLRAAGAEVT